APDGRLACLHYAALLLFPRVSTDIHLHTVIDLGTGTTAALLLITFLLLLITSLSAKVSAQETILHSFANTPDGEYPGAGLLMDAKGNLYGTTEGGGALQGGTVFVLDTSGTETILYNFPSNPENNAMSMGALVIDAQGNLCGSTWEGGSASGGTVFKLAPDGQETDLHLFTGEGGDGFLSKAGVVVDKKGNLYGTTIRGGASGSQLSGYGTVYKIDASGKETVLYSFTGKTDGGYPYASLALDTKGNLYGTTYEGGDLSCQPPYGCGTVFRVDPAGNENVLYSFTGAYPDYGASPVGGLVRDKSGNLYGTTSYGGTASYHGNVFKLSPTGTITNLYSFTGSNGDGDWPTSNLTLDDQGNLYGATNYGGSPECYLGCGVIFKVSPAGTESILFTFTGSDTGFEPSQLIRHSGHLYGATTGGGTFNVGTIFKIK
ncbi:MAG: choice-of-anchor tandem repeat GloVer-containing protein, partial [Terriglobales bacterium]